MINPGAGPPKMGSLDFVLSLDVLMIRVRKQHYNLRRQVDYNDIIGHLARKPVFGVSNKASFKPLFSSTETSERISISPEAN